MSAIRITTALGFAGLLPFIGALLALVVDVDLPFKAEQVFVFYSAIILSFLCGAVWGSLLNTNFVAPDLAETDITKIDFTKKAAALFIVSNLISLTAWASLLIYNRHLDLSLGLLISGYTVVLAAEYAMRKSLYKQVYRGYLNLRGRLTFCVVTLHLGMLTIS
jgi:hypothetical protein